MGSERGGSGFFQFGREWAWGSVPREAFRRDQLWVKLCPLMRAESVKAFAEEWVIHGPATIAARELLELAIGFGCAACGFLFYGKPAHVTIQREGPPRMLCSACRPTQPEPRRSP